MSNVLFLPVPQPKPLHSARSPHLGTIPKSVVPRVRRANRTLETNWTPAQFQLLLSQYTDCSRTVFSIAQAIGKSIQAVRNKAARHGLLRIAKVTSGVCKDPLMASLREIRLKRNIHTKALAKVLGIYHTYLTDLERGKGSPRLELLRAWCHALGVELGLLRPDTYTNAGCTYISQPAQNNTPAAQTAIDTPAPI